MGFHQSGALPNIDFDNQSFNLARQTNDEGQTFWCDFAKELSKEQIFSLNNSGRPPKKQVRKQNMNSFSSCAECTKLLGQKSCFFSGLGIPHKKMNCFSCADDTRLHNKSVKTVNYVLS